MFHSCYKFLYVGAIFLGALLLFSVQPMIAKMVLPELGGTPAVWQTVMVFFQVLLLAGYGYVHVTTQNMSLKHQVMTHRLILIVSLIFLPFALNNGSFFDRNIYPILWLFETLAYSVSVPFFVLSTTAPILQKWFSLTPHKDAQNPYFLYSASNLGSLIALISYPFVIEPLLTLNNQRFLWSSLFFAFSCIIFYISTKIIHTDNTNIFNDTLNPPPTWTQKLTWTALSFIPSSLMLGVANYITTDIGAMPLLWIIPFVLYLISFIFVFSGYTKGYQFFKKLFPFVIAITIALVFTFDTEFGSDYSFLITTIFLNVSFLWVAIRYHGELVENKPHTEHLTYFYLYMAIGGALGGIFNAIIAPQIFYSVYEYHVILVLSAIIIVQKFKFFKYYVIIAIIAISTSIFILEINNSNEYEFQERNFFGVSRIRYNYEEKFRTYIHGTTNHGFQSILADYRLKPQSYYGSVNEFIELLPPRIRQKPMAIIGLGVGTCACFAQDNQSVDIYEINPLVVKIASNSKFFTYMRDCKGDKKIILGDARIKLQQAQSRRYSIMLMDAYSSDSLPMHLLTKEAMRIYLDKLDDNGVIAFHITNRHLDLSPVLAQFADDFNLVAYDVKNQRYRMGGYNLHLYNRWIVLSKNKNIYIPYFGDTLWYPLNMTKKISWTDNYSSIFSVLK